MFVSSAAAQIGTQNHEAVEAAKGGVEGMVRTVAATYASVNIRVKAVAPSILDAAASARISSNEQIMRKSKNLFLAIA